MEVYREGSPWNERACEKAWNASGHHRRLQLGGFLVLGVGHSVGTGVRQVLA